MCEKEIIKQVTSYFGFRELSKERSPDMCRAKWVAVHFLRTEAGLLFKQIAPLIGLGSDAAAKVCFDRSQQERVTNVKLANDISKINERLSDHIKN